MARRRTPAPQLGFAFGAPVAAPLLLALAPRALTPVPLPPPRAPAPLPALPGLPGPIAVHVADESLHAALAAPQRAPMPAPFAGPLPASAQAALLDLARLSEHRAQSAYTGFSGTDKAEAPAHEGLARAYKALAAGEDPQRALAVEDARWRVYAAERAARVDSAPKIKRGPYSGASALHYGWVSPTYFEQQAIHARHMIGRALSGSYTAPPAPPRPRTPAPPVPAVPVLVPFSPPVQLEAHSISRYNGGAAIKRRYGSSTVTTFLVGPRGTPVGSWKKIDGYGETPGERKTYALDVYRRAAGGA